MEKAVRQVTDVKNQLLEASIFIFNATQNGLTPFYLIDKAVAHNKKIALGIAVSVFYEEKTEETLYLRLVKCEGAIGRFQGVELKSFCLGDDCNDNGVKCKSFPVKDEDKIGRTQRYRKYYTFSINSIPVIGTGQYAVTLVRKEEGYFEVLASYYFQVEDNR